MAEKPLEYKILCWNRSREGTVEETKRTWNDYLTTIIKSDPDIVFLQEEASKSNSLFKNRDAYKEFFSRESTNVYNVVVIKKAVFDTSLEFDIFTFIMNFVCNEHVFGVLKKPEVKSGEKVQEIINCMGPGDNAFELTRILNNVFYHFKNKDAMMKEAFTNLYKKWNNFKHQEDDEQLHTFEKFRAYLSQDFPYADDISMKVCDRLCAVPLLLQDGTSIKIIAVSSHLENSSTPEKVKSVKSLFSFLDALGESTGCDAIIVGGDFNIDILDETEITGEARQGFKIPKYDPTIHRAMHGSDYMCIDYFTYKNYCNAPDLMITINNVKAKMIVGVPDLVNATDAGQYTINIRQYETDFQKVRYASNHDPIEATLNLGPHIASPTDSSDETPPRSTAKRKRKLDKR